MTQNIVSNLLNDFAAFIKPIDDSSIPSEDRHKVNIIRFTFFARKRALTNVADAAAISNLAFIIEKLHHKIQDANLNILIKLALPLLPKMEDWLKKGVALDHIGARIEISENLGVGSHLCNHAGGDCDCGPH